MLGVHAVMLVDRMPPTLEQRQRAAVAANQRLRFTGGSGIDTRGRRVASDPDATSGQVVGFLLRDTTLAADVAFWADVARLLPSSASIRLVGYCESTRCRARFGTAELTGPAFPVVAYGEVVDSQAVLNADAEGRYVVARHAGAAWRTGVVTPNDVVKELTQ